MPPDGGLDRLVEAVHADVVEHDLDPGADPRRVVELVRARRPLLPGPAVAEVVARITHRTMGLGPLEPLLDDPEVGEVMVNGPGPVWCERAGRLEPTSIVVDRATVEHLVERIVAPLDRRADRRSPLVDARLPDGSRVNVAMPPLAVDGPCITIRRFSARRLGLDELAAPPVAALLRWAVAARWNVVVVGGTGSGKTTLLNALGSELPPNDRVVTVEDAAELQLPGRHVVRLEARPSSADGLGEVRIRDLVRNALRMRPDRIVVGEVRGAEALDMVQAMNTGHEGSLSTCHANSPVDGLRRLETLALMAELDLPLLAVREQLHASVDLVVQVARTDGARRRVVAVAEVALDPGDPARVRHLADADAVDERPTRPSRHAASPSVEPAWCGP